MMLGVNSNSFQYEYKPVSRTKQEIRLLRFKNVPFQVDKYGTEALECSIDSISLSERPHYLTLSYCWGNDTRCTPLLIDGKLMRITASLDTALRHIMLFQDLLKQPIWIDAVCINQDDDDEKSWQVQMMKEIYLGAKRSIGWLGLPDDASRLAMETAWEVKLYLAFVFAFDEQDVFRDLLPRIASDVVLTPAPGNLRRNAAIKLFLERQFFARTWIHQEVMVAKHLDLICGTDACDWEDLHMSHMCMAKHLGDTLFTGQLDGVGLSQLAAQTGPILDSMGPKIFQLRHFFEQNHLAYGLWSLVVLTRSGGAQSTNSRDAIYGVLSVAEDSKRLRISPDYHLSVEECFIQAAKAFLKGGQLDVLTACQQPRKLMGLPTWVPDFSTRWDDEFNIVTPIEHMGKAAEDTVYGSLFCASKGTASETCSFKIRGGLQILSLAGVKFDKVQELAPIFTRLNFDTLKTPDLIQDALLTQIKGIQDLLRPEESGTLSSMESILRVLTNDMELGNRIEDQNQMLHRLPPATLRQSYVPYINLLRQLRPISAFPLVALRHEFMIFYRLLSINRERRAFITSNGHLGIGPATLQCGDQISIFCGMDVPLVLRNRDDGVYNIVGEAYVDGIMDGEAMRKSDVSMFEIC